MFFLTSWYMLAMLCAARGAVLDPALFLAPSPPIAPSSYNGLTIDTWSQSLEPDENLPRHSSGETSSIPVSRRNKEVPAETKARTFWPKVRTDYLSSIHIPLTFKLSGTYGRYGSGAGVIGTSYVSLPSAWQSQSLNSYNRPSLAGAMYEINGSSLSGIRVYGSDNKPAWSGWGNGKWGHYGKG